MYPIMGLDGKFMTEMTSCALATIHSDLLQIIQSVGVTHPVEVGGGDPDLGLFGQVTHQGIAPVDVEFAKDVIEQIDGLCALMLCEQ